MWRSKITTSNSIERAPIKMVHIIQCVESEREKKMFARVFFLSFIRASRIKTTPATTTTTTACSCMLILWRDTLPEAAAARCHLSVCSVRYCRIYGFCSLFLRTGSHSLARRSRFSRFCCLISSCIGSETAATPTYHYSNMCPTLLSLYIFLLFISISLPECPFFWCCVRTF